MLMHKGAHGTGTNPTFPTQNQINENMESQPVDFMVEVYGDGSFTTPTKWWAAMGGYGAWIKGWNQTGEERDERKEQDVAAPALGQVGSSTRQELAAWIVILTRPFRSNYATDSASMQGKATYLIQVATTMQEKERRGETAANKENPCRKAWGLQRDGDLWKLAWEAIL